MDRLAALATLIASSSRLVVLTGAGCSTGSGIPDYRGPNGTWRRRRPILISEFIRSEERRRNFWARNFHGWPRFSAAQPNDVHHVIADMEQGGRLSMLITQNVDDLHQRAGSTKLIALHGTNDRVVCLQCRGAMTRVAMQELLAAHNPGWSAAPIAHAPDGDADLDPELTRTFVVPDCPECGGMLKPDLIFFGESVPRDRVERCMAAVREADALLVVGSSLTVWSGYRFALAAVEQGKPLAIVNRGETRADPIATVRVDGEAAQVLSALNGVLSDGRLQSAAYPRGENAAD